MIITFISSIGYLLFKDFCENDSDEPIQQLKFYEQVLPFCMTIISALYFELIVPFKIKNFEKTECYEERKKMAREIYDNFIMEEMLSHTYVSTQTEIKA